tara:strand:- start:394 stop:720 length:327 start_codon:yes stop_codon:yes gene_type:complete
MPKYKNEKTALNSNELYQDILDKRGIDFVQQRRTFVFSGMEFSSISVNLYTWSVGDSLHKLSQTFYGTYNYWWVIGLINNKPTDAHYNYGDEIFIPTNPELIDERIGR